MEPSDATAEPSAEPSTEEPATEPPATVEDSMAADDEAIRKAQDSQFLRFIKLVGIHRLPALAYPAAKIRGLYGSSSWLEMHGQQWPYMPESGIGISGYGWVNTGYEQIRRGDPGQEDSTLFVMEGRFVFRVTPTFTRNNFFIQTQAEFVANNNQSISQPLVSAVDDLWVRVGMWGRKNHNWDLMLGRYEAWSLFHLGMGLDLFTLERRGATEEAAVPEIYGVTHMFYRPSGVGNLALHYYPTSYLRFEGLVQYGNNSGQNTVGGRGAAIFDWGFVKVKAGGEYRKETPQSESSQLESTLWGLGGNVMFVIDPWVEFGANGAWSNVERYDVAGVFNQAGSNTSFTAGGFATVRLYKDLLLGGGVQYTRLRDEQRETLDDGTVEYGQFAHLQAYGSLQYFLFRTLMIRGVGAFARSDMNATFTEVLPYSNKMFSGRVVVTRYF